MTGKVFVYGFIDLSIFVLKMKTTTQWKKITQIAYSFHKMQKYNQTNTWNPKHQPCILKVILKILDISCALSSYFCVLN